TSHENLNTKSVKDNNNTNCECESIESVAQVVDTEVVNVTDVEQIANARFNELNLKNEYPTDRVHFNENINDSNIKRSILAYGPCRPNIAFPSSAHEDGNTYKFSSYFYSMTLKSGIKVQRFWLCYSVGLNVAYCETCWLFANRQYSYYNTAWINGVDDWRHLTFKIDKHEKSIQHIDAGKIRYNWEKNFTIDKVTEKQYSDEATYWREVLTRIIKVILSLTAGNTALRGHEHKNNDGLTTSEGNFMRTIKLLSEFDPIMNNLLNDEKKKIKYLSWQVQNEIIEILATSTQRLLCKEIQNAQCFSIIMDSTQDINKIDQVSVVIRYVVLDYELRTLKIEESFMGFFAIDQHGAKNYEKLLTDVLLKLELDVKKCKGQGYDGAAVMSGIYSGVQKRIRDIVPNAFYVHCCSHNLNLVISDAVKTTEKALHFFNTVQAIFVFFSSSAPRWSTLAFGEDVSSKIKQKVLKKVCPTRWESRHESIYPLKVRFKDVLKSLSNISLTSQKKEERSANTVLFQINSRFEGLKKVNDHFHFLHPSILVSSKEEEIVKASYDFVFKNAFKKGQPLKFVVSAPEHNVHFAGSSEDLTLSEVLWLLPHLTQRGVSLQYERV
ncbi:zinc finger MYM-type protein 1-like, partial [Myzus persicae]|uniref:zinc finger MYM-type protein 1-like n=1 Tax=Myzus persicae TaxID=13164 RepID=UPI000B9380FA